MFAMLLFVSDGALVDEKYYLLKERSIKKQNGV